MKTIASYMRAVSVSAIVSAVCAATLAAQPASMVSKLDAPRAGQQFADTSWQFMQMPPGWHVTALRGGLLYDSTRVASGQYSVDAFINLFPNPSMEGHGVFVTGHGLAGQQYSYVSFLIRRDGQYRIAQHAGDNVRVIKDWTADPAIVVHPMRDTTIANRVRVTVRRDSMVLTVNNRRVTAISSGGLRTDGMFGLRIGAGLNTHITLLDYLAHLAPIR